MKFEYSEFRFLQYQSVLIINHLDIIIQLVLQAR